MRVVFMGTPQFAVPVLEKLYNAGHNIVAVISQPDREKDRKGNIIPTPVKEFALNNGLECYQFDKISQNVDVLNKLSPDIIITAAYGQILSAEVLATPKYGVLNVHASLLPLYRGSSPVQSALICGESETGVTIMKTDISMDTGDIISTVKVKIEDSDDCNTLYDKLSNAGAELLVKTLPGYISGKIKPVKQDNSKATYCKKISKADGIIDWSLSACEIFNRIRAYNPWPIAYTYYNGVPLKIYSARVLPQKQGNIGEVTLCGNSINIACGTGSIAPLVMQLPGKKALPVEEFLRGCKIPSGTVLKNE